MQSGTIHLKFEPKYFGMKKVCAIFAKTKLIDVADKQQTN